MSSLATLQPLSGVKEGRVVVTCQRGSLGLPTPFAILGLLLQRGQGIGTEVRAPGRCPGHLGGPVLGRRWWGQPFSQQYHSEGLSNGGY